MLEAVQLADAEGRHGRSPTRTRRVKSFWAFGFQTALRGVEGGNFAALLHRLLKPKTVS